jgi:hypothetical protein
VKFVINDSPANVLNNIDPIIAGLLQILNENSTNVQAITFTSITSGSTVVGLDYSAANGGSMADAQTNLAAGLANGIPGTSYTITGVQTTLYGASSNQSSSSTNVGLIIGLVVGLTVFGKYFVI